MSGLIEEYEPPWSFAHSDIVHLIYSKGEGPSVVILHELFGLDEGCLDFGIGLSESFRVHIPLLFGAPEVKQSVRNTVHACISRELAVFSSRQTSPIVSWLRPLCAKIQTDSGLPGIGVIGMCVTGGFALALAADKSVLAPVLAQPSAPILPRGSLGLSPDEERELVERTRERGPGCVLGLRFKYDLIAPRQRIDAIQKLLGDAFHYIEFAGSLVPTRRHATLTVGLSEEALAETKAFLTRRLAKGAS